MSGNWRCFALEEIVTEIWIASMFFFWEGKTKGLNFKPLAVKTEIHSIFLLIWSMCGRLHIFYVGCKPRISSNLAAVVTKSVREVNVGMMAPCQEQ